MFERFTDRARRVVVLAQEEARRLNHNYIGTEHILLGLIQEGEGHAAKAIEELNINIDSVRSEVVEIIGEGQQSHRWQGHTRNSQSKTKASLHDLDHSWWYCPWRPF